MFKHPLLYVWIVLIGTFAGVGWLRPASEVSGITQSIGTSRPADQQKSPETKRDEAQSQQNPSTGAAPPATTSINEPKNKQDAARDNRETPKSDQSKDEDSVKWTDRWIAYVTVALAAVAIAQFIAAGLQAKWTRHAVVEAAKAADAATLALGTERAWLSFDQITPFMSTNGRMDGVPFQRAVAFKVEWKNLGRSPALHPQLALRIAVIPFAPEEVLPPLFVIDWEQHLRGFPIGPAARPVYPPPLGVADAILDAVSNRQSAVIVFSAARYRDTFNPNAIHLSEVCLRVSYDGEQVMPDGTRRPNWGIKVVGPQNTAT